MAAQQVPVTTEQAKDGISHELRNNIYSALLSYGGIRNIESTLDETLRATGFRDNLRAYITDLLRSGQVTTAEEARDMAMAKIQEQMRNQDPKATNGHAANGSANGDSSDDIDLRIPKEAINKGSKSIQAELKKVCEITYEDDK